jgi:sugar lactone lactonase YvrE
MKMKILIPAILFLQCSLMAQQVSTLLTNANVDNLTLDSVGNIYGSGYTTGKVTKITPAGVTSTYATIIEGLGGSVFDKQGNLFVSNYNNGNIYKIEPSGSYTIFVHLGANAGPAGLAIDGVGNIYAACSGTSAASLSIIKKITPMGVISDFSTGTPSNYFAPGGLVFDDLGNLYVSNYANGNICKITSSGAVSVITTIPSATNGNFVAYMAFNNGNLFVCHAGGNKIYKIDLTTNTRTLLTGTGVASSTNGGLSTASFNGPNGIAVTPDGNTIYISEIGGNNLRVISNLISGIYDYKTKAIKATATLNQHALSIKSSAFERGVLSIRLYNMEGQEVWVSSTTLENDVDFEKTFTINNLNRLAFYILTIENNGKYFNQKLFHQ